MIERSPDGSMLSVSGSLAVVSLERQNQIFDALVVVKEVLFGLMETEKLHGNDIPSVLISLLIDFERDVRAAFHVDTGIAEQLALYAEHWKEITMPRTVS